MGTVYLCVGFVLIFGSLNVKVLSLSDYALHFPTKGTSDYVNIWGMPSLTQFTVCLWVKTNATNDGTPFSYAVPGQHNEIVILGVRNPGIYIAGGSFSFTLPSTNDGKWHHVCLSWENIAGSSKLYKDGAVAKQKDSLGAGHVIKSGGSLMLAQEQDSLGGGFEINQCFIGMLTNVNGSRAFPCRNREDVKIVPLWGGKRI